MTVTHSDGYAVQPAVTDALVIGMGERFDHQRHSAHGMADENKRTVGDDLTNAKARPCSSTAVFAV